MRAGLTPVTALVFFSTAARAQIVAPDFISFSFFYIGASLFDRFASVAQNNTLRARWLHFNRSLRRRCSFPGNFDREELLHNVFLDSMDHVFKHFKSLFLVFLKRVFLPVAAQPDTFLEM